MDAEFEEDEQIRKTLEWLDSISIPFTFDDSDNVYVHADKNGIRRLVTIPPRENEEC